MALDHSDEIDWPELKIRKANTRVIVKKLWEEHDIY